MQVYDLCRVPLGAWPSNLSPQALLVFNFIKKFCIYIYRKFKEITANSKRGSDAVSSEVIYWFGKHTGFFLTRYDEGRGIKSRPV